MKYIIDRDNYFHVFAKAPHSFKYENKWCNHTFEAYALQMRIDGIVDGAWSLKGSINPYIDILDALKNKKVPMTKFILKAYEKMLIASIVSNTRFRKNMSRVPFGDEVIFTGKDGLITSATHAVFMKVRTMLHVRQQESHEAARACQNSFIANVALYTVVLQHIAAAQLTTPQVPGLFVTLDDMLSMFDMISYQ